MDAVDAVIRAMNNCPLDVDEATVREILEGPPLKPCGFFDVMEHALKED